MKSFWQRDLAFRLFALVVLGLVGKEVAEAVGVKGTWVLLPAATGAALGFLGGYRYLTGMLNHLLDRIYQVPTPTLIAGVVGLLIALLISALVTLPLSLLPGIYGRLVPMLLAFVLSYLIITFMVKRSADFFRLFGISLGNSERGSRSNALTPQPVVLIDTSALIDGRIADVSLTGFLTGKLIIPDFVLRELQHIADSTDPLRRRRGRRGLEMLTRLQREGTLPLEIVEVGAEEGMEVDDRLVKLAREWVCPIITTDFNLRRVAELHGIKVLNLNDLANAVKPIVMPGEEMELRIIQEGREQGQGVGFMDDGTMVVVDGGKRHLNNRIDVVVTRVLQTAMGRMIFAQPKEVSENGRDKG